MISRRWHAALAALLLLALTLLVPAQDRPLRVGILVYDGVYNTEFIAPLDVFEHAAVHTDGRLRVFTVAPELGSITTAEGLRVLPRYSFATSPEIDWLIVPSGEDYRADIKDEALVGWIHRMGSHAAIVHSNCWGAFLLGAAGLLDGKQATTYPQSLEEFAQAFPDVNVRRDSLLVDDDGALTSAGGVVSYDAALYIVEKHLGADVAERVANGLVIDWKERRADYESVSATPGS